MAESEATPLVQQSADHYQAGRFEEALNSARQAIEIDERLTDAYTVLGVALSGLERNEEAVSAFQKAIQVSPYNTSAYYNLALQHYQMGYKNDATAMAQEAIRTDGKHKRAIELMKKLETELHVEVAPYQTSLGDDRGAAYRYQNDAPQPTTFEDELPPIQKPPA